jgi:two-component system sensor histidine kinase BaeS
VDARFLQRQYSGLLGAALATVLVALLAAWWVAGRWSRPLRELQLATQRIASGELAVQIPVGSAAGASHSGAVEIEHLISDVNAMASALAKLEAARRNWIAEISHELRTPLAVLRGELEAIEDGARQPTVKVLSSLGEEVMQLSRLVDDLHTLAVADLGQMPCEFSSGEANLALQKIVHRFDIRAAQLGLQLVIGPMGPPVEVNWDFGRIAQLVSNLIENSLRYTTAPGRILVHWSVSSDVLVLTLEDSAPGVNAADLVKLFEPLFRVDKARTRTGQHGSGLGLSIVRAVARAHSGSAQALTSALGGIAVRVELPLQPQRMDRRQAR